MTCVWILRCLKAFRQCRIQDSGRNVATIHHLSPWSLSCSVLHVRTKKQKQTWFVKNFAHQDASAFPRPDLSLFSPENLNVTHFSRLADCPRRAIVWSGFGSEWLPKFHTHPLNHIFSGLELTSLISWKSAISDIIPLSSWPALRKAPAGRFRPPRLLQSEAKALFTEQKKNF